MVGRVDCLRVPRLEVELLEVGARFPLVHDRFVLIGPGELPRLGYFSMASSMMSTPSPGLSGTGTCPSMVGG